MLSTKFIILISVLVTCVFSKVIRRKSDEPQIFFLSLDNFSQAGLTLEDAVRMFPTADNLTLLPKYSKILLGFKVKGEMEKILHGPGVSYNGVTLKIDEYPN